MLAYHYVESINEVTNLCRLIDDLTYDDYISLDTEFIRENSLYPKLALIQLKIKDEIYLVDGFTSSLKKLLNSLNHTKAYVLVFSGSEDISIIAKLSFDNQLDKLIFDRCYDVQLMASFCNHSYKRSLSFYVEEICKVNLLKACTRSDWLQRPLTKEQMSYAAEDVEYLKALYDYFKDLISEKNFDYFTQEMQERIKDYLKQDDVENAYRQVNGNSNLKADGLKRLYYICKKRYEYAIENDIALNHVITTKALFNIARDCPNNSYAFAKCNVTHGCIRMHANLIKQWVRESIAFAKTSNIKLKPCDDFLTHFEGYLEMYSRLVSYIKEIAKREGISCEILLVKRDLHEFFMSYYLDTKTSNLQRSWRLSLLGNLDKFVDNKFIDKVKSYNLN